MSKRKKVKKKIVGLVEKVTLIGPTGKNKTINAKIDTGATKGSIDKKIAKNLKLGPVIRKKVVKSASGNKERPFVKAKIKIGNRQIETIFNLANRGHLKYKVLVGQNILKKGFLIDPSKK